MIRLFVDQPLGAGARVALREDQARYLLAVMRRGVGDELLVFNGRDGEWRARIAEATKRSAALRVQAQERAQAFGPDLELIVALVKRDRLETIVEKAAELGVRRARLCLTRRTQADHTNVARLQAIATEASEQAGRLDVPEVVAPERLDRMLDGWDGGRRLMFCDEGPAFDAGGGGAASSLDGEGRRPALRAMLGGLSSPPPQVGAAVRASEALGGSGGARDAMHPASPDRTRAAASLGAAASVSQRMKRREEASADDQADLRASSLSAASTAPTGSWAVLIGPEGGFAPEERERLRAAPFTTAVSLGPRILRADTAAIAALTLWQAALGDWR